MLSITGLHNFYFLPHFHDMRCKARRISDMIRVKYHRDPLNGDVYVFMSKDQTKVKMIHYENHAFYVHEKSFPSISAALLMYTINCRRPRNLVM